MSSKWSRAVLMMAAMCGLASEAACRREAVSPPAPARNVVLITIDTLRADRVGAYGYAGARTPTLDALAGGGTRFDRAYAPAPITLTTHASLLSGRYPAGHGARHNGLRIKADVPLITELFQRAGFKTGAFVGAFPLDRRFGLERGFQAYGDRMPRLAGVAANERPGWMVVDEALDWLKTADAARFFLWVHLFEPHAPYGLPSDGRPAGARYDDEIAEAVFNLFNAINPAFNTVGAASYSSFYTGTLANHTPNTVLMKPQSYAGDNGQPEQRVGQIGFRFVF